MNLVGTNPNANGVYSSNQMAAPYRRYNIRTRYRYNSGYIAIPTAYTTGQPLQAGSRQPQTIVQLSASYSFRKVEFDIIREGAAVILPAPTPLDSNDCTF